MTIQRTNPQRKDRLEEVQEAIQWLSKQPDGPQKNLILQVLEETISAIQYIRTL